MIRILTMAHTVWLEMLRRKDAYVLLILLGALLFVLMSADVFGLGSTVRYIADAGLLLSWVFSLILAITLVGRQLPTEQERGTIFPLLAKPVRRIEVLLGKWLGGWTAVSAATLTFYVLLVVIVWLRGGKLATVSLIQAIVLHITALAIVSALALALSTRMSFGAAATSAFVVLAASYLIVPRIPTLLANETGFRFEALLVLYYALPHFEFFDMRQRVIHGWGPVAWPTFSSLVLYGLVFVAIFLLLAWCGYRRKRFKRGGMA